MNMNLTLHLKFKTPSSAHGGFLRVIGNATYLFKNILLNCRNFKENPIKVV